MNFKSLVCQKEKQYKVKMPVLGADMISVQLSITHRKSGIIGGVTYSSFCFIFVIIQRSTEKCRLDFRTLPTNQMRPTVTLAVVHHASEGEREKSLGTFVIDFFKSFEIKGHLAVLALPFSSVL